MQPAYEHILAAYYDRMQGAYDRTQLHAIAYDFLSGGRRWKTLVPVVIYEYL